MKFSQFRAFAAVTEHRSIRGAARELSLSQPAVTKIVRELERELDAPLVYRSVRGIELTDCGQALAVRARLLMEEVRRTREEIDSIKRGAVGSVVVMVSTTSALTVLPRAFAAFRRASPQATVTVNESDRIHGLMKLRDGTVDFIVVHKLSGAEWTEDPDFETTPLFNVGMVIGARKGNPLHRARSLKGLQKAEWCAPSYGYGTNDLLRAIYHPYGMPEPRNIIHSQSLTVIVALVKSSDALGLFGQPLAKLVLERFDIQPLSVRESLPVITVGIVRRRGALPTPAARRFIQCFEDAGRQIRESGVADAIESFP